MQIFYQNKKRMFGKLKWIEMTKSQFCFNRIESLIPAFIP